MIRFVFLKYHSGCSVENGCEKNLDAETSEKADKIIQKRKKKFCARLEVVAARLG